MLSQRCAWCEKVHAQVGCVARVWPGAFALLLVPRCCQVFKNLNFNSLLCGNSGLLTKIVNADIAVGASYRKCWTAEFIEACVGLRAADTFANCIKAATPLPLQDFCATNQWWICVSACVRDGGSWMVQILGRTLKNWLHIMLGWPYLSNQAMYGAPPICYLGTWSWNQVGMCFGTLLAFACMPTP